MEKKEEKKFEFCLQKMVLYNKILILLPKNHDF